jgi:hypothetical protein
LSASGQYRIETWKTRWALNFERCVGLLSQLSRKAFGGQQRLSTSGSRNSVGAYVTLSIDSEQFSSNERTSDAAAVARTQGASRSPIDRRPARSRAHWVRPELIAEVTYLTWTAEGLLRHVVYEGLREDKPARDVRRTG